MTDTQPIDSAFTGGQLGLVPLDAQAHTGSALDTQTLTAGLTDSLPVTLAIIVITVLCIASLRTFVSLIQPVWGCVLRWKENINLEDNVLLAISRDRIFYLLILPFCILASGHRLYDPDFMEGLPPLYYFLATTGAFILYMALRKVCSLCFRGKKTNMKVYSFATHSFRTFFIIIAVLTLATSGILLAADAPATLSRKILLCECALVYGLFLIRKTQIFGHSCSLFSAFLYLCALEFLPTGILVATAIVL